MTAQRKPSNVIIVPDLSAQPRRAPKAPKDVQDLGVVDQVRKAFRPSARLATTIGFLIGGFIPLASYFLAHQEIDPSRPLYGQVGTYLVLGALIFSAKTIYEWARLAFVNVPKALGFVVLLEGVSTLSTTTWLSISALVFLVGINGIATGCRLSTSAR